MVLDKIKNFKRKDLAKRFADLGLNKGVEVGVRNGRYSETLCLKNPNIKLWSVDPYDIIYGDVRTEKTGVRKHNENYERAKKKLSPYNCKVVKKTSLDAVKDFDYESLDFVYIDGSHEFDYVMCDIIEWGKRVKKGGIISGHDYYRFVHAGIVEAVNLYCKMHKVKKINLTDEKTPSWWIKKTW